MNDTTTPRTPLAKKPKRSDGGLACGKPAFVFQPLTNTKRFHFKTKVTCFFCENTFIVRYGFISATFTIGNEVVGISCDNCLSPEGRSQAEELRSGKVTR